MPIDFPSSPTLNQTYTFGNKTWKWNNTGWEVVSSGLAIDATAADILSVTSNQITADDAGSDKIVFWDDSASKLTHLTPGAGLSVEDTTINASMALMLALG